MATLYSRSGPLVVLWLRAGAHALLGGLAISIACASCARDADRVMPRTLVARLSATVTQAGCTLAPQTDALGSGSCLQQLSGAETAAMVRRTGAEPGEAPAEALHGAVTATLMSTDAGTLDSAIERVRAAEREMGADRYALAAGALLHARATLSARPATLLDALEATERALQGRPSPAALFNRALILGDLGLCRVAAQAWRAFLEAEVDDGWAREGRARLLSLACLRARTVSAPATSDDDFEAAMEENLHRWTTCSAADCTALLDDQTRLGDRLGESGDELVRSLADELPLLGGRPSYRASVRALVGGRRAYKAEDYAGAASMLLEAAPGLKRNGSVLEPWCQVWRGGVELNRGRFTSARAILTECLRSPISTRSPMLQGRTRWLLGLSYLREGRLSQAFDDFARAETELGHAGYTRAQAAVRTLKAETLASLGLLRDSWRDRILAVRALQAPHPHFALHNALIEGADVAQRLGATASAAAMLEEALLISEAEGDQASLSEVVARQAEVARQQGLRSAAREGFLTARELSSHVPDSSVRERLTNNASLGLWSLHEGRTESFDVLDQLAAFYAARGPRWRELAALTLKARLLERQGDPAGAQSALDRAVLVIREQGNSVSKPPAVIRYLESVRDVFDARISIALDTGQPREALRLLEESRELRGHDRSGSGLGYPAAADPRIHLVYASLPEGWRWWRVVDGVVASGRLPSEVVREYGAQFTGGQSLSKAALARAYDLLLAPALAGTSRERPLAIVPDAALYGVPFAALRNPATGVHLIQERAVTVHMSVFDACHPKPAPVRARSRIRATVVGDPAFDRALLPWLPPLRHAANEARQVASLYGGGTLLLGTEATASAVRDSFATSDILHIATHTIAGTEASDSFVLAPEKEASGLTSADAFEPVAGRLSLVVLSGCSTLGDQPTRWGPMGLARPFVRGGAAVLVTLRPADDRSLAELTVSFHRRILEGLTASESLRQVQLEAIAAAPDKCCDWATLQLIGDTAAMRPN
jgi:tetratricopeptide (TPR) repeat protein